MRSYAETISSSGSGPLVAANSREAPQSSAVWKVLAVVLAVAVVGGAAFATIRYGVDDTDLAPRSATDGAFLEGFDPNSTGSSQAGPAPVPPKPPKDPISEDPEEATASASPRATPAAPAPERAQPGPAAGAPAAPEPVGPGSLPPAFFRHALRHKIDQEVMDYRFGDMLGDTFMFYEAQHSGNITEIPGGSRHGWRGPQMLQDGSDVDMDLTGGLYEAGNRLKITLATSYLVSHLGWLCTYYEDTLAALPYDGETVLHWCKREVRWGLDYLLRTHRFPGPERPSTWTDATDSLVLMANMSGGGQPKSSP